MTPWGAIIMQLEKAYRRGEYAAVLRFYLEQGIPIYDMVSAGNVEGGDFMVLKPGVAICGYSGERSVEPAVNQIRGWFEAEGWEVMLTDIDPFYVHIDLMVVMLAPKLAAVCLESTDPDVVTWLKSKNIEIISVPFQDTPVSYTHLRAHET